MMGDRERCIQAQMDEYLSKPLQQNHLIQTILKCATLGGALLEKNREKDYPQNDQIRPRPSLEGRAITSAEPLMGLNSPALVVDTDKNPFERTRSTLSEPSTN